jgi:hypothetical protein
MLARGPGAALVPVALVYWAANAGWRRGLWSTGLALVGVAAVLTPWTVRNAVEMHAFIPVSTNSGVALRSGHAPEATGTVIWTDDVIDGFRTWESLYQPDWEVKGYREYTRRAVVYAVTHPFRELQLSGLKIYHTYRSDSVVMPYLTVFVTEPLRPAGLDDVLVRVFDYPYYVLLFGAAASVPLWLRRDANGHLLLSVFAFWTVFHVIYLGEPRYHLPVIPIFCLAFAAGFWALVGKASAARAWWKGRAAAALPAAPEAGAARPR